MSAFGPFKNEVEIPFLEFGNSGLFLVTGDTGAGKTTIFDAISFALFGNASGENRTTDCFRSDFSGSEEKTYVDLTFLHKNKSYRVIRNPLYMRNKLKGGGLTQEKANATLTFPDGRVVAGYNQVTEAITNLLGIDWKQYKQIAMIAQGEFLQLLTADSAERGIIFRKVFGTQIYDDVQKKLKIMASVSRNQCDDLDKSILQFLDGIACDDGNAHYKAIEEWKDTKDIHQVSKIMELLSLLLDADKQRYKSEDKNKDLLQAKINEKAIEHTNAIRDNQMLINLQQALIQYDELMKSAKEMQKLQSDNMAAKKALYSVKPAEEIYLRTKRELDQLFENIKVQEEEIKKSEANLTICQKFLKEKEADEPRINQLNLKIGRQEDELKKYQLVLELETEKSVFQQKKQQFEQSIQKLLDEKEDLNKEQVEKLKEFEQYQNPERDILECQNTIKSQNLLIDRFDKLIEALEVLSKENIKLGKLQDELIKAQENYLIQNNYFMKAEELFYREQAGILAASLTEGSPCPVCGSIHHPNKTIQTASAPSEEQLKKDKNVLEASHQIVIISGNACSNQKTKVDMLKKQLQDNINEIIQPAEILPQEELYQSVKERLKNEKLFLKELKEKEKRLLLVCNQKITCSKRLSEITEKLVKLNETIDHNNREILQAANQLSLADGKLSTLRSDLQFPTIEEARQALDADRKEYIKLQEALQKAKSELQNIETKLSNQTAVLEDNKKKLNQKQTEVKAEEKVLEERLKQNGFENSSEYHEHLISETMLDDLVNKVETYQKSCDNTKTQIEQLRKEIQNTQRKDLAAIKLQQQELEKQKAESDDLMQKIYSRIKINADISYKANEIYKEQEASRQEYLVISDLSKTANGELSGKAKIAFEQYVQAFYFNSVIKEANKRLYKMSNNQFILLRKEDPSNLRSVTGLELVVMDYYTGKPRSIKSLSGGESFKAALSLALGLSDVIQSFAGGIDVDAMFIDEGFGSLDSNSLEQAIDTLNALTTGNRFVGIISHVSELKERIDKKIFIEKGLDGSRLRLIN